MSLYRGLRKNELLNMYRKMEEIRQFELKAVELFTAGELPGFLHSYLGQEASAVGICANLEKDDYITSTHRGHGHVIAKGADMKKMMAELYGKVTGYCRGKGGSMHIMDRQLGILGANGIVGGGIPIATGAGLSIKIRKTKQVAVCFFGDGASNQGSFHESLNLASIWELPVIFVCENNLYAESTSQEYHQRIKDVAVRGKAYDIYSDIANGNDVIDVYERAKKAINLARNGKGPVLLETKTYRWLGHYVGDPGVYRAKEEVEKWKSKEPLGRFRNVLIENSIANQNELDEIVKAVETEVNEAVEYAKNSEDPTLEMALEDVLASH
jgi:pyruvate dehydrogenase E1 component alpha subunit